MLEKEEKYLTAKEMSAALEDKGLTVSASYVRLLWKEGAPHIGRCGRLSELLDWWKENPDVQPRARRNNGSGVKVV